MDELRAQVARLQAELDRVKAVSRRQVQELHAENERLRAELEHLRMFVESDDEDQSSARQRGAAAGADRQSAVASGAVLTSSIVLDHSALRRTLPGRMGLDVAEAHGSRNPLCLAACPLATDLLASGGVDRNIMVWCLRRGRVVATVECGAPVVCVAWNPTRHGGTAVLAGAGMDGAVWVVHLPLEELLAIDSEAPALLVSPMFTERAHGKYTTACAWSPDGTILASSGADRTLVLYGSFLAAAAPSKLATVALTGACEAVAFARSPRDDSTVLLAAVRNTPQLHCYTLASTVGSTTPGAPTLAEWGLALSEVGDSHVSFTVLHMSPCPWDASIVALATDHGAILLADVGARTMHHAIRGLAQSDLGTPRVRWHPDPRHGLLLVNTPAACGVRAFVAATGTEILVDESVPAPALWRCHEQPVRDLAVWAAADGVTARMATVSFDKRLRVWHAGEE